MEDRSKGKTTCTRRGMIQFYQTYLSTSISVKRSSNLNMDLFISNSTYILNKTNTQENWNPSYVDKFNVSNSDADTKDTLDLRYYTSPDLPNWLWTTSSVVMAITGSLGVASNLIVIIAYIRNKSLHDEFNRMLMNLVFAETIIAAFGIPVDFTASILHGWKMGKTLCYVTGFLLTFSGMVSIYTLTAISIQRWWIMKSTIKTIAAQMSRDSVLSSIFIGLSSHSAITMTWILALFLAVAPLLGWSHYEPEISGMSCGPAWHDPDSASYVIYILIVGFVIPNFIIIYTSAGIIQYQKMTSRPSCRNIAKLRAKRESKVTRMIAIMIVAFNVSWTPYALICTIQLFGPVHPSWAVPCLLLAKSSCCWNPIIYVFMNKKFHNAILPPRLHNMMKKEFGTQGAAAMAVAIAITKNPLFTPGIEETCIEDRRSEVVHNVPLDGVIDNGKDDSNEHERLFFQRSKNISKSVSMSNFHVKTFDIYFEDNRILKCFSYTNVSLSS